MGVGSGGFIIGRCTLFEQALSITAACYSAVAGQQGHGRVECKIALSNLTPLLWGVFTHVRPVFSLRLTLFHIRLSLSNLFSFSPLVLAQFLMVQPFFLLTLICIYDFRSVYVALDLGSG